MANILIIDDDDFLCDMLSVHIKRMGHDVSCAHTGQNGLKEAIANEFDLVFLDVRLPDMNGLDILPQIRETPSSPEVIIITGGGDPEGAELAINSGAWDYLQKTSSIRKEISLSLVRALQYREEKQTTHPPVALIKEIIGSSPKMKRCFDLLAHASNSDVNVLITGETGTGKEIFARAIHDNSFRPVANFVVVDCAALPETLVESLLFGYTKGAFTGAHEANVGLIKQADGGTLFLDEIGELPFTLQKAFLRVLQERRFRPLGAQHEETSNFRLVAATNRNLTEMIEKRQFRKDLLFRIRTLNIELPPLRDRREDIIGIALHYTAKLCLKHGLEIKGFSPEFFSIISQYNWPGNVRELINTIERAITAAQNEHTLFPKHLPTEIRVEMAKKVFEKEGNKQLDNFGDKFHSVSSFPTYRNFNDTIISETKKKYCQDLMALTGGNIKEACRISGLSRGHLYELLKKYNISRPHRSIL